MSGYQDIFSPGNLGYCVIFACIGVSFLFLRNVDRKEVGIRSWAIGFFSNSAGFLFWSPAIHLAPGPSFLLGEAFHVVGFLALAWGAYRFSGNSYKTWNLIALAAWILAWLVALGLLVRHRDLGAFLLKFLRAALFLGAGTVILRTISDKSLTGRKLSGLSLLAWGGYQFVSAVWKFTDSVDLKFGILIGFHLLAAFGMVAMVVDKMRIRAERSEEKAEHLEGLLPICSHCKNIRDEDNTWHSIESYIADHSPAEFSHGICPDCAKKHYPDFQKK